MYSSVALPTIKYLRNNVKLKPFRGDLKQADSSWRRQAPAARGLVAPDFVKPSLQGD